MSHKHSWDTPSPTYLAKFSVEILARWVADLLSLPSTLHDHQRYKLALLLIDNAYSRIDYNRFNRLVAAVIMEAHSPWSSHKPWNDRQTGKIRPGQPEMV